MFLLDTNIVSELVKRSADAKVISRLNSEPPHTVFVSSITVFELRFGAARSAKPAALWSRIQREILGRFDILPFDEKAALASADLMSALASYGQTAVLQDIWLAGGPFI